MPKIVDPEARRRAVAEAALRVIAREGLEHASLRNVAEEAGLAIGSVRHYFAGHTELVLFAMDEMSRRVEERIRGHAERILDPAGGTDRRAGTEELLAEFLPLDKTRREETVLWLAFTTASRTRPELRPRAQELYDGMLGLTTHVLTEMRRAGGLAEDLDVEVESVRLYALLDGLALQAALWPERVTPETMRTALRRHLDGLARPERN